MKCSIGELCLAALLTLSAAPLPASEPLIRVLVWDEQQPAQKQAYENFLGNAIADHLDKQPGLRVISATINQPEKGLPASLLDNADVPEPDEVLFEETWAAGETFRSGNICELGDGRVFYFRPGHEIYPVFKQELPLKIVANAVTWLGSNLNKKP